ncbi:hypothetical protein C8R41DRAFT_915110 [Lentinula lateritia]|uniref:Uncharacterized protein n=1 Tax=Lentinula lateritia TaxID=40482 RepID=A0ABQ8VTV1_9AGAR|nr:hypothetical protein C8R41DRAFT_915110 [Lentinula lateritia]
MLTGFEIPIIAAFTGKVVATFKFSPTSVLLDDTRNILNDERLTKLLTLLYELDPKLAFENNEFREEVEAMFNDLSLMKGGKYILIRHISARKAKSLAKEYKHMITKNTNDARIKQAQDVVTRQEAGGGKSEYAKERQRRDTETSTRHRGKHKAQMKEIVISNNSGIASEANHTSNQKGI